MLARVLKYLDLASKCITYYFDSEQQSRWSGYVDAEADLPHCCSQMEKRVFLWRGSFQNYQIMSVEWQHESTKVKAKT